MIIGQKIIYMMKISEDMLKNNHIYYHNFSYILLNLKDESNTSQKQKKNNIYDEKNDFM